VKFLIVCDEVAGRLPHYEGLTCINPRHFAVPPDYKGQVVCEHCPDYAHPLNDDGTICKFPKAVTRE
jgi:hypothetical protein